MYYKHSVSQCGNVCQIIAPFQETGVSESKATSKFWLEAAKPHFECKHSTKLAKNSPEQLAQRRTASSCNAFTIATFSSWN